MKKFAVIITVVITIIIGMGFGNKAFGDEYNTSVIEAYDNLPKVTESRFDDLCRDSKYRFISQNLRWNENTLRFQWTITAYNTEIDTIRTETVYYTPSYLVYMYNWILNN